MDLAKYISRFLAALLLCGGDIRAQVFNESAPVFTKRAEVAKALAAAQEKSEETTGAAQELKGNVDATVAMLAQAKANGAQADTLAGLEKQAADLKANYESVAAMAANSNAEIDRLQKEARRIDAAMQEYLPPAIALYDRDPVKIARDRAKAYPGAAANVLIDAPFTAMVQVRTPAKQVLEYRYDGFQECERIVGADGTVFAHNVGKPWLESPDWGVDRSGSA